MFNNRTGMDDDMVADVCTDIRTQPAFSMQPVPRVTDVEINARG